jgi:DNA-binding response OmpR family regulator
MSERARILVVEDEEPIRRGICDLLAYRGHAPVGVATGTEGLEEALSGAYDLLVLDVMLPGVDGFTICERAREAWPGQAILVLTARGREGDVLEGFQRGCDDYVAKPFSVAQLTARIEALLRRARTQRPRTLTLGPLTVDVGNLVARGEGGEVTLSARDVEVLAHLALERRVVSREELLREVWGYQRVEGVETRCVDMHMVKLRRKLSRALPERSVIETVRGAGYRLEVP